MYANAHFRLRLNRKLNGFYHGYNHQLALPQVSEQKPDPSLRSGKTSRLKTQTCFVRQRSRLCQYDVIAVRRRSMIPHAVITGYML